MKRIFQGVLVRAAGIVLIAAGASTSLHAATATRSSFGKLADGTEVEAVELKNAKGVKARIIAYGAMLQTLDAPDRKGVIDAITIGYDAFEDYEKAPRFFGPTVGRFANRIAGGRFELDGKTYQLALNNNKNALHGGVRGFDKRLWRIAEVKSGKDSASVALTRESPDGEEGYPGNLSVRVTFELSETNELSIRYRATTDQPTIVNLTNHTVFNLAGATSGRGAQDSLLQIEADGYLPVDDGLIPTGVVQPLAGTAFDFRKPALLGPRLRDGRDSQVVLAHGIDHNFVLRGGVTAKPKLALIMVDPTSGRGLRILTTEPGLQVATSNGYNGTVVGHGGMLLRQGDGIVLEAQRFPDTPNKPAFPSARLDPGGTYEQLTIFQLFVAPRNLQ